MIVALNRNAVKASLKLIILASCDAFEAASGQNMQALRNSLKTMKLHFDAVETEVVEE